MHADGTGPAPCARAGTTFAKSSATPLLVGFCTVVFVLNAAGILTTFLTDGFARQKDFITYWCPAREAVMGRNPYDETAIGRLERSGLSGFGAATHHAERAVQCAAGIPTSFFRLKSASLLWSALILLAAWVSVQLLDATYGCLGSKINLLAYAFARLLSCFIAGQTSVFALLGCFCDFTPSGPFLLELASDFAR